MQLLHKLHSYSKEQLQAYQFEEMIKLLRYVNEHSKFYNELYKNINIEDIKAIEDIKKLPIVTKEISRKNMKDVITIPKKGAKISLIDVANSFKYAPNTIIKTQFIQETINRLIVKIVVDNSFSLKHKYLLIDEIKHKFENDMKVDIEIVDDIPREKSGKHRLIKNLIK